MKLLDIIRPTSAPTPSPAAPSSGKAGVATIPLREFEGKALISGPRRAFWLMGNDGGVPDLDDESAEGLKAYIASHLAFAAIRWRASKLAEAPLYVARETEDGIGTASPHPLDRFLAEVNLDQTASEAVYLTEVYLMTTGRALWIKQKTLGGELDAQVFSGDEIDKIEPTFDPRPRRFGRFRVRVRKAGGSDFEWLEADDVLFFHEVNPREPTEGLAPVDVALRWLNVGQSLSVVVRNALKNSAMLGGVFTSEKRLDDSEYDRLNRMIRRKYSGTKNSGLPFLAEGGLSYTKTALNLQELAQGELYREVEAAVCLTFGVRPEILGTLIGLENSPWSHMDTARRLSYDETVLPQARRYEDVLSRGLLTDDDRFAAEPLSIRFDWTSVRALAEDDGDKARTAAVNADIWTVNERRTYTGKDPSDDPAADEIPEISKKAATAALAEALRGRPGAANPPGDEGGADEAEEGTGDDEGGEEGEEEAKVGTLAPWAGRDALEVKVEADVRRMVFDAITRAAEPAYELAASALIEEDRTAVVALAEDFLKEDRRRKSGEADLETKGVTSGSGDEFVRQVKKYLGGKSADAWLARMRPLIRASAEQAAEIAAADVGLEFAAVYPFLDDYVAREAGFLIKSISNTTLESVQTALRDGIGEGQSVYEMGRRMAQLPEFDRQRGRLVARTETTRVVNGAPREGLAEISRKSGTQFVKTWVAIVDDRTRDEHADIDGETRAIDEEFSNGLQAPGEPNCRCTLIYSRVDDV